ncbi:uncharacterized protein [Physcomitrium patens]
MYVYAQRLDVWWGMNLNACWCVDFSGVLGGKEFRAMSSSGSCSTNKDINDDARSVCNQFSSPYNDPPIPQDAMTTQPSVGRFTESEKPISMFSRKPPGPRSPYEGQGMAGQSNYGIHSQDSSSTQSPSGSIVNLRADLRTDGKVNTTISKGKK